jgi:predicted ArsR family transcriptional regulator
MQKEITSARREILEILKKKTAMTADGLSKLIGTSAVAIRQHLTALEADGLVSSHIERRPVGRPVQVFTLSEEADDLFPKTYHDLTNMILEEMCEVGGQEAVREVFERRRRKLVAEYRPLMLGKDLEGRVATLARIADEMGCMAEWEPSEGGYTLTEHNCVIARVARRFPQACEQEQELFADLLGAHVTRRCHICRGDGACSYFIYSNGHSQVPPEAAD